MIMTEGDRERLSRDELGGGPSDFLVSRPTEQHYRVPMRCVPPYQNTLPYLDIMGAGDDTSCQ